VFLFFINHLNVSSKCVLCVDDDPETLTARRLLLEAQGYFVRTASSGQQALALVNGQVDIVLLDYLMPGMKGDELAHRLRAQFPAITLIGISAVHPLPREFLEKIDFHVNKGEAPEQLLRCISQSVSHAGPQASSASRRTVLCVEDDEQQLKLRKMLFESAGYNVIPARSGATALNAFRSSTVDAVVMDYWLSGENGTAIAEQIKHLSPRTPIVMFSGYSSLPGEGALIDAWLRKASIQPEDLLQEVKRLIELRSSGPTTQP